MGTAVHCGALCEAAEVGCMKGARLVDGWPLA